MTYRAGGRTRPPAPRFPLSRGNFKVSFRSTLVLTSGDLSSQRSLMASFWSWIMDKQNLDPKVDRIANALDELVDAVTTWIDDEQITGIRHAELSQALRLDGIVASAKTIELVAESVKAHAHEAAAVRS